MKTTKTTTTTLIATAILLFTPVSYALDGTYIGASFGKSEIEADFEGLGLDGSDSGLRFTAGFKLKESIDIEAFYEDFGKVSDSTSLNFVPVNLKTEYKGFGVAALISSDLSPQLRGFARLGFIMSDGTVSGDIPGIFSMSEDVDGTDLIYGLGVKYKLDQQFKLRGEWEAVNVDDGDFSMLSIGIEMKL